VNESWVLVAHAYKPSYAGGRDQEDCSLKPAKSFVRPYLKKKPLQKRAGEVAQGGVNPEFKPQYHKKKKKKSE
jgi:hypothetical protein